MAAPLDIDAVMSTLQYTFKRSKGVTRNAECSCCYSELKSYDDTAEHYACGESFCSECLAHWISSSQADIGNATCPHCKGSVRVAAGTYGRVNWAQDRLHERQKRPTSKTLHLLRDMEELNWRLREVHHDIDEHELELDFMNEVNEYVGLSRYRYPCSRPLTRLIRRSSNMSEADREFLRSREAEGYSRYTEFVFPGAPDHGFCYLIPPCYHVLPSRQALIQRFNEAEVRRFEKWEINHPLAASSGIETAALLSCLKDQDKSAVTLINYYSDRDPSIRWKGLRRTQPVQHRCVGGCILLFPLPGSAPENNQITLTESEDLPKEARAAAALIPLRLWAHVFGSYLPELPRIMNHDKFKQILDMYKQHEKFLERFREAWSDDYFSHVDFYHDLDAQGELALLHNDSQPGSVALDLLKDFVRTTGMWKHEAEALAHLLHDIVSQVVRQFETIVGHCGTPEMRARQSRYNDVLLEVAREKGEAEAKKAASGTTGAAEGS